MLDKLPLEVLLEIYQYLSPEQAPAISLIDKKHDRFVYNPFWERKFEIHFPYLLNELPKDEPRNWYAIFQKVYHDEYARLSKQQRAWFSSVKEGKLAELADLSMEDLLSLEDAKGINLISWAKKKQYQHGLDYFWSSIVAPFFISPSNLKDKYGNSILHLAVLLNQKKWVETLITSGKVEVDINASSKNTPLHVAAREGHVDIVKMLLEKGASINAKSKAGATALLFAVENNHPDIVNLLLEQGADTSIPLDRTSSYHDKFKIYPGDTPLHAAIKLNRKDIVQQLLAKGADVNALTSSKNTPLHVAAREGHVDIVKILLEKGASINAKSKAGATALLFAVENNHSDIVNLLLEQGADTSIPLDENTPYHDDFKVRKGDTPLHVAIRLGQKDIVNQLLAKEADVNALASSKNTPLHVAAREGHVDIVKILLEKGASINAKSKAGATALLFAVENNHPDIVNLLLEQGADTSIPLDENTPYHDDFKVRKGDTPLHVAIRLGQKDIVKQLFARKYKKDVLLEAAKRIINSNGQGSYVQERKNKTGSFFKPRDVRTDQLKALEKLNESSPIELIVETFITISKSIHQEYHFGGESTLANLIDQALDKATTDETKSLLFKR